MDLSKEAIQQIIRQVIAEELGKTGTSARQLDPSGVIGIDPAKVQLEDFPFPIESDRVKLVDVLDLDESPRLGCGLMEMDHTKFAWTLTYDEIDVVLEGTLEIIVDGRVTRATAGQIIYIPKNTSIQFSTPDRVRFIYVCYPANWADQ
jgi:ethanolamine utilization protein EutQ